MKLINYFIILLVSVALTGVLSCTDDVPELGALNSPGGLSFSVDITQDGSGLVTFNASASNAIVYHFYPGLSLTESPEVSTSGSLQYFYRVSGDYTARVVAYGSGGTSSNATVAVSVEVDFKPPADLVNALTAGVSRNWVWEKSVPAHLGVGPPDQGEPIWYTAQPFEKESFGCLYEDVITFTLNGNNSISFELNNNGVTFFHFEEVNAELGEPQPVEDQCYNYDVGGVKAVGFFESASGIPTTTNISFNIASKGFMSYFLGTSNFEIIEYSADRIHVRCIQTTDNGEQRAWYMKFIAEDAVEVTPKDYELVWADSFEVDGAPNSNNWGYDIGTGDDGWGNQEEQYYTDRADNVFVDNGTLKIVAKRETFSGSMFTSARIKTQDKFEFTYGKVEVRAKLPKGGGTWPAIWLLGADLETNPWPAAGEMDIMEHIGNDQDRIQAAIHTPSSFGDTQNKGNIVVNGVSEEFHIYSMEWDAEKIDFFVDDNKFYTYNPANKDTNTWPFDKDFFIILNVAMGGTLGGTIDGAFTESTMEVDYVKVFQEK